MSRYAQPMSQTLAQMQMNELKMNDPKLNKIFDKLKKGDKIKLKTSSTMSKGSDFVEYIVKSKNVVNKGKVEKITLATVGNEKAVKKFLYRRDGKVTFAMGDMAASIDDIKEELEEGYESEVLKVLDDAGIDGYFRNGKLYVDKRDAKAAKDALEDADNIMKLPKMVKEDVELDEAMKYTHAVVDPDGKVAGMASNEKDAKDIASRHKGKVVKLKKPMSDKKGDMMINRPLEERPIDPADIDDLATDADKKAADKNMVMQMRKALDVKGNMPIEFGDGKKEKVDPKILQLMVTAHGKIQKPRDKEKFVAMISKSKRDMLMVAKKLGTLKMDLDKEDEPIVKKVVQMLKKASQAHAGQASDLDKAIKETLDIKEGTWKMPDNPKEVAALKKLMSRPLPIGNTEDDKLYKDSASSKLYSLLGDDELFDALGELEDKGKEKADARPVIIKWFQKRVKDNSYDLGDETKALGKAIGLKMEYVPEGLDENYRKLAMMGIGTETKKAAKVGLKTDYYLPKNGDKSFGKITRVTSSGYEITDEKTKKVHKFKFYDPNNDPTSVRGTREEVELDEKYELYHKTFSDAMQHAYDYAKKKLGITVDPKEIDNKVATGPKKPSEGKTNKYRLKGKGGNLQIQVYNKGGSKPFELNMYKEENDMTKSLKDTIVEMWTDSITEKVEYVEYKFKNEKDAKAAKAYFDGIQLMSFDVNDDNVRGGELMVDAGSKDMTKYHKEVMKKFKPKVMTQEGFASDAQRKAAFASGYKEKGKKKDKEEGNEFSGALDKARKAGKKTFKVGDKEYPVKPAKKESVERYHQTKQGSLRDAVLQMWGEGVKEDKKTLTKEKKDGNVKKMTDTGKEVTPVDMSPKMPKIKEAKNKV